MIKRVSLKYGDSPKQSLGGSAGGSAGEVPEVAAGAPAEQPLVLIPVEAEDVLRRRRRRILAISLGGLALALAAAFLYKISVDPIHAQDSYDSGMRLMKIGRYSQAILSFDHAVALKRDFADAYWARARGYLSLEQPENAIHDFTKVIQLRPNDALPLVDRGRVYAGQKDYQSAIDDANHAIAIDSKLGTAYCLRGIAVRATGNVKAAFQDFDRAVTLEPNATNYYERGATYQLLGEHRLAIDDFTEMIKFRPDSAAGWFARAESERAVGELEQAKADHHQGRIIDGR